MPADPGSGEIGEWDVLVEQFCVNLKLLLEIFSAEKLKCVMQIISCPIPACLASAYAKI